MSYILEALTRSEKQRERSTIPTLTTAYLTQESKLTTHGLWQLMTIGLMSIAVVAAVYFASTRYFGPHAEHSLAREEAAAGSALDSGATRSADISAQPGPPAPAEPVSDGASRTPTRSNENVLDQVASARVGEHSQAGDGYIKASTARSTAKPSFETTESQAQGSAKSSKQPLSPQSRWLAEEILALRREAEQGTPGERAVSAAPADAQQPTSAGVSGSDATGESGHAVDGATAKAQSEQTADLPLLAELPLAKRKAIPPLEMNVHAYARSRGDRKVLINMRVYREGERLREGPMVDAITPSGVELTFDDQRFRLLAH